MKKRFVYVVIIVISIISFLSNPIFAEYIFLKNGEIHKGIIVNESAASVSLKLETGKIRIFQRNNIMRLLYTNIYMGQQYIRLTDGKVIQAYMVDEDQNTYTFRKDLNKPVEFKIPRSKVLFMARKNPNELAGEADFTTIKISWKPPMGTVKKYNIYVKEKFKQYPEKPYDTTSSTSYRITGLKSSTDYNVIVTAVDDKGHESLPSNELQLMTKNKAPDAPKKLKFIMVNNWRGKLLKATIRWQTAKDPDGNIREYRIFLRKGNKKYNQVSVFKLTGALRKEKEIQYNITGLTNKTEYGVIIKAVDNKNVESDFSNELSFTTKNRNPYSPGLLRIEKRKYAGRGVISAKINWKEAIDPDGQIKVYRIFEKTKKGYRLIAITPETDYLLRGLGLDREYIFEVRAVDNRGIESDDNNIVKLSTHNDPPDPVYNIKKKQVFNKKKTRLTIILSWDAADDADGKVVKYRIYLKTGKKKKLVGESNRTVFTIRNLNVRKKYHFIVISVDNRGVESTGKKYTKKKKFQFKEVDGKSHGICLNVDGLFLMPVENFAKMYSVGGGFNLSLSYERLFVQNLTIGIKTGFHYFTPDHKLFDYTFIVPFMMSLAYKIQITNIFRLVPNFSVGGCYNRVKYNADTKASYNITADVKDKVQPMFSAGLYLEFVLHENILLDVGAEYSAQVENSKLFDYITIFAGAGYRF